MEELGIPFRVVETGHTDESYPSQLKGGEIAVYLAELKSDAYKGSLQDREILLTADTIVWHDGEELGKPVSPEEAMDMLNRLAGNAHQVFTGVSLRSNLKQVSFSAVTDVTFSPLEEEEIMTYISKYKPFDKAGAYGIQEWIGYIAVERIVGSYFNVMGLPVQKLYQELKLFLSDTTG
jgi:septum formation protein